MISRRVLVAGGAAIGRPHPTLGQAVVLVAAAADGRTPDGGPLLDAHGRLIGINTMTGDKRVAEGLGFAIAFPTLLELLPDSIDLPAANRKDGDE